MPLYKVTFARSARRDIQALPLIVAERILAKIDLLILNPRPHGYKKLQGHNNLFRIRIGAYRVIYSIDDASLIVDISVVRHRSEAYR